MSQGWLICKEATARGAGERKREEGGRLDAASAEPSVRSAWPQASLSGTLVSPGRSVKRCFHVCQCSSQMHQCVPFPAARGSGSDMRDSIFGINSFHTQARSDDTQMLSDDWGYLVVKEIVP